MARIEYLSESEIKKFEKAPEFENDIERNYYFTLPTLIHKQTVNFINDESFIILTLMFGYFKVTNKFFELNSFSPIDTKFISDKYQLSTFDSNVTFTSRTIQRYKQLIKTHLGINEYNNDIESKLQQYYQLGNSNSLTQIVSDDLPYFSAFEHLLPTTSKQRWNRQQSQCLPPSPFLLLFYPKLNLY